jgi:hypothetical protein
MQGAVLHMAYFEMILLVAVALTGLILLALVVSSGPVSHRRTTHQRSRRTPGPPARPWSRSWPSGTAPVTRTASRHHSASRCAYQGVDRSRLVDPSGRRAPGVEVER